MKRWLALTSTSIIGRLNKMKVAIIAALIFSTTDSLKWIVKSNPILFGDFVSLVCMVTENACPEDYVRRWVGGPGQNLISLNYKSSNTQKYQMSRIHNSTSFELIIYNFNEIDLECEYTCSCGLELFSKTLSLFDNKLEFIYPIQNWTINHTVVIKNRQLNIDVSIEKVYPSPICRLKLNDIVTIPNMTFTENYSVGQLLPRVTCAENITVNDSLCSALLIIECWNQTNGPFLSVLQKKLKIAEHCNISGSFHSWITLTTAVTTVCCTISFVFVAYFIWQFLGAKKMLQKGLNKARERRTIFRKDSMLTMTTV